MMDIIKVGDQAKGQFNGGEILEHKPIGFPQDGSRQEPYSNLFYWAHAWTDVGSTIGEHPHQGFEIMSFVIEGDIEHYDSQQKGWSSLPKGSAQVIRAGSGISHAEKMNKGSHMFQIWLDPDLSKTMSQPASYDDYLPETFTSTKLDGMAVKVYAGEGGPMKLDTPGVEIKEIEFEKGFHKISAEADKIYSIFMLRGSARIESGDLTQGDFAILGNATSISVEASEGAAIFTISSPKNVNYATYA